MEQPTIPNAKEKKKKAPSPQELISHYQSKGLDSEEASVKVIEDLQNVLFRVVSSRNKKDRLSGETLRKLEVVHNRLGIIDMKIDSKPGYFETFALGFASASAFRGVETVWPHLLGGISNIWAAVSSATNPSSSSS